MPSPKNSSKSKKSSPKKFISPKKSSPKKSSQSKKSSVQQKLSENKKKIAAVTVSLAALGLGGYLLNKTGRRTNVPKEPIQLSNFKKDVKQASIKTETNISDNRTRIPKKLNPVANIYQYDTEEFYRSTG